MQNPAILLSIETQCIKHNPIEILYGSILIERPFNGGYCDIQFTRFLHKHTTESWFQIHDKKRTILNLYCTRMYFRMYCIKLRSNFLIRMLCLNIFRPVFPLVCIHYFYLQLKILFETLEVSIYVYHHTCIKY